jgi:hypothetical protein
VTELEIGAADLDGNLSATQHLSVRIDRTAPSVAFRGVHHYAIYQTVSIDCAASDEGSGLTEDCSGMDATALRLGLGSHSVTRTVTDRAGNTTTATFDYSVDLTPEVAAMAAAALLLAAIAAMLAARPKRAPLPQPAA